MSVHPTKTWIPMAFAVACAVAWSCGTSSDEDPSQAGGASSDAGANGEGSSVLVDGSALADGAGPADGTVADSPVEAGSAHTPIDLCAGLVGDKLAHPMTALAKPAVGQTVIDAQFGTTIRRITSVAATGANPAIRPLYSTVSAWNADESRLLLYNVATGEHSLYDGKTYAFIEALAVDPPDVEQVYWHTSEPDWLLYVSNKTLVRYHVSTHAKETLGTFSACSANATAGDDPMFTSWDSNRLGLGCGGSLFIWDVALAKDTGRKTLGGNPAQVAPSGTLAYLSDTGEVTDPTLTVARKLDLVEPFGHASLGRFANGHDTWNGVVFDPGPLGNDDIGTLVSFDLTDGKSKVVIGPKTGWPYPPTAHLSSLAIRQPGWVFVSTIGNHSGAGTLDDENLVADTNTGAVCRIGRHRSYGKDNTHLAEPYWAEPHTVPSPSGTRAVFASDWGNGATVDAYVVELPSYKP